MTAVLYLHHLLEVNFIHHTQLSVGLVPRLVTYGMVFQSISSQLVCARMLYEFISPDFHLFISLWCLYLIELFTQR